MAEKSATHPWSGDGGDGTRQRLGAEEAAGAACGLLDELEIAVDGGFLIGKGLNHALTPGGAPGDILKALIADDDGVVDIAHGLPLEAVAGDLVEEPPDGGLGVVNLADIVQTDVPVIVLALEHMGEAAGLGVALQDQNPLFGAFCEQSGNPETADARPDDDGVVIAFRLPAAIGSSGLAHDFTSML